MQEIWKDIPGYEGFYQASNLGFIKSIKSKNHKILKGCLNETGYHRVAFVLNGKFKTHLTHRLIASTFIKNEQNKPEVNHIDGNKLNNSVENLEWCTRQENIEHAVKNKLFNNGPKGIRNYKSKLTEEQVRQIKYGLNHVNSNQVSKMFGVGSSIIYEIRQGKYWKHI